VSNEPLYPFGYGLSYTTFEYGDIKLDKKRNDCFRFHNRFDRRYEHGSRDGAEVVQLYVRDLVGSVTRPVKELKDFKKVLFKAGRRRPFSSLSKRTTYHFIIQS
jgi:beta-glucosidase